MKRVLISSIHLLILSSLLVFSTACQQRPDRPSPDQTIGGMGPGGMGAGDDLPFDMVGGGDGLFFESDTGLQARGAGDLYGEQVRGMLEPIYFEFDRSNLAPAERAKAIAAAEYLRNNPRDRLLIEGHCDWRGTTEYNLGLGDRRASSVRDYLTSLGTDTNRVEILSKGDLEAVQGGTDQQMARDRRAELVILRN